MSLRSLADRFSRLIAVPAGHPELLVAQYRAFSRQLPMMYVILVASTWGVASTHIAHTPAWLSIGMPVLLSIGCAIRLSLWYRSRRVEPTPEMALRELARTNRLSVLFAVVFTGWALMLFPYGDDYARSHVAFYMAITVIGCIFCLMHLRSAALQVAAIVNGTFVCFFVATGEPSLVATSLNVALVSFVMLVILLINYRDFTRMIDAQVRTQALSDENLRLANLDILTQLPNRRAFFAHLDTAFAAAVAKGERLAVGILDLDGFKPVNDLHGHLTGDQLLVAVAQRLAALCTGDDVHLSRLGGDEFALVIRGVTRDDDVLARGEALCAALAAPFRWQEVTVQIAGSIGFAVYPEMAASSVELFERADYALYQGKRDKRGRATLFSADHNAALHRDAGIEQALQMADLMQELEVVFQPIVDIDAQRTIAFEALARWNSPTLGRVSPGHFIPVAERAGLIGRLTRPLLAKALAAASGWPDEVRLSFNLSARDLSAPEGVPAIVELIEASGFDARRLDFEVTETAFTQDFGLVRQSIDRLRHLGCGVSLDDFGTGYSSLSHLHALPLTKIKIDRSFVTGLHLKPASFKIVKSLLALSRDMGLDCVVEGVETTEEMETLRVLGCRIVQGYFYSPPIAADAVEGFLSAPPRQAALLCAVGG